MSPALTDTAVAARSAARLARFVEKALVEAELTMPQYRLLSFLSRGESAASRLAERLSVSKPRLTGLVDSLVTRGLVERGAPHDRRRVSHRLTDEAGSVLARADAAVGQRFEALAAHLTDAEADAAFRGLALWAEAVHRAGAATDRDTDTRGPR